MLELKDFVYLAPLDGLLNEIAQDPGLTLVAGLEPRSLEGVSLPDRFEPGGRSMIAALLARRMLAARRGLRALVLADAKPTFRISARDRHKLEYLPPGPPSTLAAALRRARGRGFGLLIVEQLGPETLPVILNAALDGLNVLAGLDTVLRGADVARQLADLGATPAQVRPLAWVVAVQRVPALCRRCKQPEELSPARRTEIRAQANISLTLGSAFRAGSGCEECGGTGRKGSVMAFDVFNAGAPPDRRGVLSLKDYMLGLADQGYLPFDDALRLDAEELPRAYRLLAASEQALARANATLQAKLTELEVANRVLQQQTEASISLQEISHALITLTGVQELADYVCRKAHELCGADRAVLYLIRPGPLVEILAVNGWDPALLHGELTEEQALGPGGVARLAQDAAVTPFTGYPPGIEQRAADLEGSRVLAGLRVPLIAHGEPVGLVIFNSTLKRRFSPREVALLQAFANQGALAIQRADLFEALRDKIEQLEAAQAEIVKKERLERELELARQVQQSMLPKTFPMAPGFEFAAESEPARRVGGDLYDVFLLDGDRFGIVIGDVSDKGLPAALFMALTRSLLLAEARRERSPYLVLNRVNRLLLELSRPTLFVTVFYGVVNTTTRTLTFVRAGHERPLLLRRGEAQQLAGEGGVLGLLEAEELRLTEETVQLEHGDRLVLFTDGLADALSPAGHPFGLDRLTRLLERESAAPLEAMCRSVFDELREYQESAEQYDDMTLLAVQVK